MAKRRVTREDDPVLEIDYVTGKVKHLADPSDRICTFTLRADDICSHYFTILPPEANELIGRQLRQYLLEHIAFAQHTRTCEKVR